MVKALLGKLWAKFEHTGAKPRAYYEGLLPKPLASDEPIEKEIHQTYYTRQVPQEISDNIARLKALNPDYIYRLWTDEDIEQFIRDEYGDAMLSYYHRINPKYGAARADLFRYLLIYKRGGVYLDLKSSITKPLSETLLPTDSYILAHWDNGPGELHEGRAIEDFQDLHDELPRGEYVQWCIISKKRSPQLFSVLIRVLENIDKYNPYLNAVGIPAVLRTTGPIAYSWGILRSQATQVARIIELSQLGWVYSIYEQDADTAFKHKELYSKKKSYDTLMEALIPSRYALLNFSCVVLFTIWGGVINIYSKFR